MYRKASLFFVIPPSVRQVGKCRGLAQRPITPTAGGKASISPRPALDRASTFEKLKFGCGVGYQTAVASQPMGTAEVQIATNPISG